VVEQILSDWRGEFEREAPGLAAGPAETGGAGEERTGPRPGPAGPWGDAILRAMEPAEAYRLENWRPERASPRCR